MVLAQLAARGLGVAIVPASVAKARRDLHPLTIVQPELRGRLAFAWRSDGPISPAAQALVGRARTCSTCDECTPSAGGRPPHVLST